MEIEKGLFGGLKGALRTYRYLGTGRSRAGRHVQRAEGLGTWGTRLGRTGWGRAGGQGEVATGGAASGERVRGSGSPRAPVAVMHAPDRPIRGCVLLGVWNGIPLGVSRASRGI